MKRTHPLKWPKINKRRNTKKEGKKWYTRRKRKQQRVTLRHTECNQELRLWSTERKIPLSLQIKEDSQNWPRRMRRAKKQLVIIVIKITMRNHMEAKTKPDMVDVLRVMRVRTPKAMTMEVATKMIKNMAKRQGKTKKIKTKRSSRNSCVKLTQHNKSNVKKMLAVSARLKREIAFKRWKRRKKKQSREKKKDSSRRSLRWKRKKDKHRNCARSKSKRSVSRKCKRRRRERKPRPRQERRQKLRRRKKSLPKQLQISNSKKQISSLNRLRSLKIICLLEE